MKKRNFYILILILISVFFSRDDRSVSAENEQQRIRFQVTTIGESASGREILAQTTIEGLPGTDFRINLQTGNFKMETRFLTDLVGENKLKIRANLNTRRFYGYSPINLPLYEEDAQKQTLELGLDETVVLLPFGRGGAAETLKIEIKPTLFSVPKSDEDAQNLVINFDKKISSGEIYIAASKTPHHFQAEAVLLADGKEIAKGNANCLLEEEQEILLRSLDESENQNYRAKLTVNRYSRNRPKDLVDFDFGFYRSQSESQVLPIETGAGIGAIGDETAYQLDSKNLPDKRKYELKFRIRLDEKEN